MAEVNETADRIVGVEVTRSMLSAVCLDPDGTLVDSFQTQTVSDEETVIHLGSFVTELKTRFGKFDKIGIAVPGLINKQTSRVAYSTRNPEHTEIDLLEEIAKVAGVKIHIENDANAAAFGEYHLGSGRGAKDMFYVTLGRGVGGALIFDNKLWHGDSGFAGEFGYVAINSEGMRLEEFASSGAVLRRTRERFHQDPTSSLNTIGEDNITISDLIAEAKKEDGFAELMLERTGFYVGTALAGVINLLNVERIVIGGEIMEAGDLLLNSIKSRAKELSFAPSFETVEIAMGELGKNASAIGAALLSQDDD